MEKYNRDMTTVWHQYDTYFSIECGKVKSYLENDENIVGKPQIGQFEKKNKIGYCMHQLSYLILQPYSIIWHRQSHTTF